MTSFLLPLIYLSVFIISLLTIVMRKCLHRRDVLPMETVVKTLLDSLYNSAVITLVIFLILQVP